MENLFAKIVSGELPAYKIYEDDFTLAFLDIKPVNIGHVLVIPKKQYRDIEDIPQDEFIQVMKTVHLLAPIVKDATQADGINIVNNNGAAAGQMVWHYNVHIIPRFKDDGFKGWHGKRVPSTEELTAMQTKIKLSF